MLLCEVTDLSIVIPDCKIGAQYADVSGRLDWAGPPGTVHCALGFMTLNQGDACIVPG